MSSRRATRLMLDCLDERVLPGALVPLVPADALAAKANTSVTSGSSAAKANVQIRDLPPVNADRQNYSHIRVAMLAFSGTPLGNFEQNLLKRSIDLLIPNVRYLDRYNSASPGTPQLIYTNVSNIYLGLYTDWLNYADSRRIDREAAFFHVNKAVPFSGDSGSSKPVTWFWGIYGGSDTAGWKEYTPITKNSDTSFNFAPPGQSVSIGYPDKFRELNFDISRRGNSRWSGVLEYASAVNSAGKPTAWKTLTTTSNTTSGFRQTGKVLFDPPADWKATSVNGSARLFYVRVRSTGTGEGPSVRNVLGRDYVGANRSIRGTIPAFDKKADSNRDGYLNDSEYSRRTRGMDARFAYESRLFYTPYGQMRFATNPSNKLFQAWALDHSKSFIAAHPNSDGLFFDNSYGRLQNKSTDLIEPVANYANDYGAMLGTINKAIGTKWVLANTSGAGASAMPLAKQGVSFLEEFGLRPMSHNFVQFEDTAKIVADRLKAMGPNGYAILDTFPGSFSPTDPRTQIAALAYYYLLGDPKKTYVMFNGGYEPSSAWQRHWTDAVKYNVGKPTSAFTTFASGRDPANRSLTFKVYQRQYQNALVLYKPVAYAKGVNGTTHNSTATFHKLTGRYRLLKADGTLGPVVTSVLLRNGEGAILVKA